MWAPRLGVFAGSTRTGAGGFCWALIDGACDWGLAARGWLAAGAAATFRFARWLFVRGRMRTCTGYSPRTTKLSVNERKK